MHRTTPAQPRRIDRTPVSHGSSGDRVVHAALPSGRQTTPPVPGTGRPRREGFGAALLWGGSGFLIGAVFWHFIGFWDFMSAVVLGDQEAKRRAQEGGGSWAVRIFVPHSPARGASAKKGPAVAATCTSVALDRPSGHTVAKPCPPILPTAPAAIAAKSDRLPSIADLPLAPADRADADAVRQAATDPVAKNAAPSRIETMSVKLPSPWTVQSKP